MSRILQCLVWITVMAASAHPQTGSPYGYWQNSRTITFPDSTRLNYEHPRQSSQENIENHQDRTHRIQNRVSVENIQLTKRGAIDSLTGDRVVFPGASSESRFQDIPEECKRLGYCENTANYPKENVAKAIDLLGDVAKERFQVDVLDKDEVRITQRLGEADSTQLAIGLCNATEKILFPDFLRDEQDKWWPVVQLKERKLLQGLRVETCNTRKSCDLRISTPRDYSTTCVQKFVYRTVWALENNQMTRKQLKLPTCCSCVLLKN